MNPGGLELTVTLPITRSAHTVLTCESANTSNPAFCDDKRADETVRSTEDLPLTLSAQFTGFPESLPTTPGTISGLIASTAPACTERNVSGEGGAYDRVTCMVSSSGTWTLVTTHR